jgi:hypothetical protein
MLGERSRLPASRSVLNLNSLSRFAGPEIETDILHPARNSDTIPAMLSILFMSLACFAPNGAEPLTAPRAITQPGTSVVSLVGLEHEVGWLPPSSDYPLFLWQLPVVPESFPRITPVDAATIDLVALQDDDTTNCQPNGNEVTQLFLGAPQAPVVLTFTIPFACPDGSTVWRTVKHTYVLRNVLVRRTQYQTSSNPEIICPPLVTNSSSQMLMSETYEYLDNIGCPNECCVVKSSHFKVEENLAPIFGPVQSNTVKIVCPDGQAGTQTTEVVEIFILRRNVTTTTFASVCPGVACPPTTVNGPWNQILHRTETKVIIDCN